MRERGFTDLTQDGLVRKEKKEAEGGEGKRVSREKHHAKIGASDKTPDQVHKERRRKALGCGKSGGK